MYPEKLTNIDLLRERLRRISIQRAYSDSDTWADYSLMIFELKEEIERCEQLPTVQTDFESHIEERLYRALSKLHIRISDRPVCQFEVGPYRLDMAYPHVKLGIECDGASYHSTIKQQAHDRDRDEYLKGEGWTIIRFSGSAIYRAPDDCVERVRRTLIHLQYRNR